MSKTLTEIFKEAAEAKTKPAIPFVAAEYIEYYQEGMAAGMELMYKALGWRSVRECVIGQRYLCRSGAGEHYWVGKSIGDYWFDLGDGSDAIANKDVMCQLVIADLTTLEKLLQEQINKGGKE